MFPDVTVNNMTLPVIAIIGVSMMAVSLADINFVGVKCGQKYCNTSEYCSPFDTHCRPCAIACDSTSHNYQPQECMKDCQVYLYDQRYVKRIDSKEYDDLKAQVERLRVYWMITTTVTGFLLLAIVYLLGKKIQFQKIPNTLRAVCRKNLKRAANKNKVQNDVEIGGSKQNGLKLAIPSISASVEPKIMKNGINGSCNTNETSTTPNTTSTPLSRRCASEDTTLDYAYDNPAMTPSPEVAQLRTKARESSF